MIESTDAFKKFAGDKSWNQLDFQTQSQIRLMAILEQSTKKYGDEVRQNTASNVAKLTASFQNLTKRVGDIILPLFNKLVTIATKLTNVFLNLSPKTQKLIVLMAGLAAAIGPVLVAVGSLMTLWATFGARIVASTVPIIAITVAIAAWGYAGWKLYNDWEDVRDGMKIVLLELQGFFVSIFNKIVNFTFDIFRKILEKVQMIGGVIGKLFPSIGKNIDELKIKFDKAQKEMKTDQVRKELELQEKKLNIVTEAVERGRQANIKASEKEKERQQSIDALNKIMDTNISLTTTNTDATSDLKDEVEELAYTYEDLRQEVADSITELGEGVVDALKNMYDDQLKMEEESAERSIKIIELRTQREIGEYEKAYRAKLKTLDEETRASIEAVENQIDSIKEQTEKEEKELDKQEYLNKYMEKQKQLDAEESAEKREKIARELAEMVAKRERELLLEQRSEQINALNEEIKNIKTTAKEKEEILKSELDAEKRNLQLKADEQKNFYEMQLMDAKEYHEERIKEENLEAEARIALIQANQEDIVKLIESYNPKWKNAGKSLGERFLEGLSSTEASIRNKINSITGSISTTMAKAKTLNTPASNSLMDGFRVIPRADSGIVVNVTGNTISGQREADKMASSIVSRLRVAGVNP